MSISAIIKEYALNSKLQWKPTNFKTINDSVHGMIKLYEPLDQLLDTPEVQRTEDIMQLGFVHRVYRSAKHDRLTHSLGTYHLALKHVKKLKKKEECITGNDMLCVCIAALVHDLGHGPYSHLYTDFLKIVDPEFEFRHEQFSQRIFEHILQKHDELKKTLDQYLTDEDYAFIKELIDPPKKFMDDHGTWLLHGCEDKSFLYDIVSNVHDSIDVDKLDYLLRDSKETGYNIPFGKHNLNRIQTYMEARLYNGYKRICYAKKVNGDIETIMKSREKLHIYVYQHKTKIAMEHRILKAMVLASPYLKFKGSNGELFDLAHAHHDLEAFLQLDDNILSQIRRSTIKELEESRNILKRVKIRQKIKFIGKILLTDDDKHLKHTEKQLEEEVKRKIIEKDEDIKCDIIVVVKKIHRGMGSYVEPFTEVLFYNSKNPNDKPIKLSKEICFQLSNQKPCVAMVYVYVPEDTPREVEHKVCDAYKQVAEDYKTDIPLKRVMSHLQEYELKRRIKELELELMCLCDKRKSCNRKNKTKSCRKHHKMLKPRAL